MIEHKSGRSKQLSAHSVPTFENCQDLFGKGMIAVSALHSPGVAAFGKKKRTKGFPAEAALASMKRGQGRRTANPVSPNKHSLTCKG